MASPTRFSLPPDVAELLAARAQAVHRDPQAVLEDVLRAALSTPASVGEAPSSRGGILEALRRSPLVGADLDLTRDVEPGREVDL
jgi:hypothetical protein